MSYKKILLQIWAQELHHHDVLTTTNSGSLTARNEINLSEEMTTSSAPTVENRIFQSVDEDEPSTSGKEPVIETPVIKVTKKSKKKKKAISSKTTERKHLVIQKKNGKRSIKEHNYCGSTKPLKHQCSLCGIRFKFPHQMNEHIKRHSSAKPFSCEICGKTFSYKCNVKLHMRTHKRKDGVECSVCRRTFRYGSSLVKHMETHKDEKSYNTNENLPSAELEEAETSKFSESKTQEPLTADPGEEILESVEDVLSTNLTDHSYPQFENNLNDVALNELYYSKSAGDKNINCEEKLESDDLAADHSKIHNELNIQATEDVSTTTTGNSTPSSSSTNDVISIDDDTLFDPFVCIICEQKFLEGRDYLLHMRMRHPDVKPHHSPNCPKSYTKAAILKTHLKFHSLRNSTAVKIPICIYGSRFDLRKISLKLKRRHSKCIHSRRRRTNALLFGNLYDQMAIPVVTID